MALKDEWKETGKDIGHAFKSLGKTLPKALKPLKSGRMRKKDRITKRAKRRKTIIPETINNPIDRPYPIL